MSESVIDGKPNPFLKFLIELQRRFGQFGNVIFSKDESKLSSVGLDLTVIAAAVVLTGATYFLLNTWLARSVDSAYYNTPASKILRSGTLDEKVAELVGSANADPRIANEPFVKDAIRSLSEKASCRDLLISLIQSVQNSLPAAATASLDHQMRGQRVGFPFLYLNLTPTSGSAVIDDLKTNNPEWQHKNALIESDATPLKSKDVDVFLAKVVDRVAQENRAELRSLMRISGWIQWLTVIVFWVVLLLCAKRFVNLNSLAEPANGVRPVDEATQDRVYGAFEFLISLLPSLGFVGTVLGMGDALLTADGLFSTPDKAQAISVITKHLGFAFDTTLVGLVTGMICGGAMLALRNMEGKRTEQQQSSKPGVAA
jgi:hypothetical protein